MSMNSFLTIKIIAGFNELPPDDISTIPTRGRRT